MVVTVIFNHPAHVTFCITHLFLFETTLGPFQPALYLITTAKKRRGSIEYHHISRMVVSICGFYVLLERRSQHSQLSQGLVPLAFCSLRSCGYTACSFLLLTTS